MSARGVRRENAALSSGCESHPVLAPTGSSRSGYGGNEIAEAFGKHVTIYGDSASVQAVTRVNAEQASKRTMHGPTHNPFGEADAAGMIERKLNPVVVPG
jgi:hypothetical protein